MKSAILCLIFCNAIWASKGLDTTYQTLLTELSNNLHHDLSEIQKQDPTPIYYGSARVHDSAYWSLSTDLGRTFSEVSGVHRWGQIELRLGDANLDQSHPLPDDAVLSNAGIFVVPLSLNPKLNLQNRRLWRLATEQAFRSAKERYLKVAQAEETQRKSVLNVPDFSNEPVQKHIIALDQPHLDTTGQGFVKAKLTQISAHFLQHPNLTYSNLVFEKKRTVRLLVNTQGSQVMDFDTLSTFLAVMTIKHPDGSDISLVETRSFGTYPSAQQLDSLDQIIQSQLNLLDSIYNAPVLEPYVGPVLLEGRGAAVFLHEILGHRIESDRFRLSNDGQTFLSRLNQPIFPNFINISDDPTLRTWQGEILNGFYQYDDEGVKATGTQVVQDGILKSFLANRSPALADGHSTANGRGILNSKPMTRMSNLVLRSSQTTPDSTMRAKLIEMARKQGLPYGLIIRDLSGGFTNTTRFMPQAFKLTPYYVVQVFTDGRPDRIARGLDLAGTPLVSLGHIVATGSRSYVFNGYCGAESGWLPVSAISPGLLFDKLEFQKQEVQASLPPFLKAPR